jgi:hypothetical protein
MKKLLLLFPVLCSLAFAQGGILGGNGVIGGSGVLGGGSSGLPSVVKIGSCGTSFVANCSITDTPGTPIGHGIVIFDATNASTSTFTITNSGTSNTYQTDISNFLSNSNTISVMSGYVAHAISASGTITISASNGASEDHAYIAYDVSLFASSSWLDQSATSATAFGTAWTSGTTSATTNANDVLFVGYCVSATNTISYTTGWTALDTALHTENRYLFTAWNYTTTTGTQSETATAGTADNPASLIVAYKQ